ncbi:hypothetical protein EDB84DRAFT_1447622 [Lactarius hengduanensis]|nr:hypothetical protein EDB84DRAFT_1447622 [Lactarius hengduanensis]
MSVRGLSGLFKRTKGTEEGNGGGKFSCSTGGQEGLVGYALVVDGGVRSRDARGDRGSDGIRGGRFQGARRRGQARRGDQAAGVSTRAEEGRVMGDGSPDRGSPPWTSVEGDARGVRGDGRRGAESGLRGRRERRGDERNRGWWRTRGGTQDYCDGDDLALQTWTLLDGKAGLGPPTLAAESAEWNIPETSKNSVHEKTV